MRAHTALGGRAGIAASLVAVLPPHPELGEWRHGVVLSKHLMTLERWIVLYQGTADAGLRELVAYAVVDCVSRLHAAGWVHGDLKPDNMMLEWTGTGPRIVLIDLDQARRAGEALPHEITITPECCAPGACVRACARGAPARQCRAVRLLTPARRTRRCAELLRRWSGGSGAGVASTAEPAADVFATGIILLRLLTSGAPVFDSPEAATAALVPAGGGVPPSRLACLSDPKRGVLSRMLAPAPGDRLSAPAASEALHASQGLSRLGGIASGVRRLEAAVGAVAEDVRTGVDVAMAAAAADAEAAARKE